MIKIICDNEGIKKEIFEFVRSKFPSYEKNGLIRIEIDFFNRIIYFYSDFYNNKFYYKLSSYKTKFEIKKAIYLNINKYFLVNDKWGILTGVRPTKLMIKLLENNNLKKAKYILKNDYLLEDTAINLLKEIYDVEEKIIYPENSNKYSIYVHIPFCPTKCTYCSFQTFINNEFIEEYVDIIIKEINLSKKYFKTSPTSIYFGGGTPTAIGTKNLYRIINAINEYGSPKEYTVECGRIDTINEDILNMLLENNVDRISINPQSFIKNTLNSINRNTSINEFYSIYDLVKSMDFKTVNMDLIMGLPKENMSDMLFSLKSAIDLSPDNITIHTLALKNGSFLYNNNYVNNSDLDDVINNTREILKQNDYYPYYMYRQKRMVGSGENIGYTTKGNECIYNILMMEEKQTIIGFGLSSSSKLYYPLEKQSKLIMNYKGLKEYLNKQLDKLDERFKLYEDFNF